MISPDQLLALRRALTGEPVPRPLRASLRRSTFCASDGTITDTGRAVARSEAAQRVQACCVCTGPVETAYTIPDGSEICPGCLILVGKSCKGSRTGADRWTPPWWNSIF